MSAYIEKSDLKVDSQVVEFIETRALPGTGVAADAFWAGLSDLVNGFGDENRALLAKRAEIQGQIDAWYKEQGDAALDPTAQEAFLREIGYLVPEGEDFAIETANTDPEIAKVAGAQLVVPVMNARYALNAANARWGSLYDALYGTDALGDLPAGKGYDAERGGRVIAWGKAFLDDALPLANGSWADVNKVTAGTTMTPALKNANAYVGYQGAADAPTAIVLKNNGLHVILDIDASTAVGAADAAGISDIRMESAMSAIMDCEDSVAAVDAEDKVLFIDKTFVPLVAAIHDKLEHLEQIVLMESDVGDARNSLPGIIAYDDLLATGDTGYIWPDLDENCASSLCYTSGTTGNPKGVLFSHRSTVLHSFGSNLADSIGFSAMDVVLMVVPMFHVNAWGSPYACAMVGARLVLPGPGLDGASLVGLIDAYQVTVALGVPTIWLGLLGAAKAANSKLISLKRTVVGGSACPPSMIATFRDTYDVELIHAWGMTEMSPLGTVNQPLAKHRDVPIKDLHHLRENQGRAVYGVELEIWDDAVRATDHNGEQTHYARWNDIIPMAAASLQRTRDLLPILKMEGDVDYFDPYGILQPAGCEVSAAVPTEYISDVDAILVQLTCEDQDVGGVNSIWFVLPADEG